MDGRERLLFEGSSALGDRELLALVLGSGTRAYPVGAVADQLLRDGLGILRRRTPLDLSQEPGMGIAQACRVSASIELGRRALLYPPTDRPRILGARPALRLLWPRLAHLPHEEVWVLLLSPGLELLATTRVAQGGVATCSFKPGEAFRAALMIGALRVIFAHNHPSGDPTPSDGDHRVHMSLEEAGRTLGISVLDHLIVAERGATSAREGRFERPDLAAEEPA